MNPSDRVLHHFSAMAGPAVNRQLAAFLREAIRSGRLKAGERLPPLRRLSELWNTNYFSVQLATEELMREGLLEKFSGKGIYVCGHTAVTRVGIFVSKRWPLTEYNFSDTLLFFLCRKLEERKVESMIFEDVRPIAEHHIPSPRVLDAVNSGAVQAMIAFGVSLPEIKWLERLPVRLVMLNDLQRPDCLNSKPEELFVPALEKLRHCGCRRVAAIVPGDPAALRTALKRNVLLNIFRRNGVRIMPRNTMLMPVDTGKSFEELGYEAFGRLYSNRPRPDALIVYPDHAARGVINAVLQCGVRVPEELRIVFHRNTELPYFCPFPVDYIECGIAETADRLIAKLLDSDPETITAR